MYNSGCPSSNAKAKSAICIANVKNMYLGRKDKSKVIVRAHSKTVLMAFGKKVVTSLIMHMVNVEPKR